MQTSTKIALGVGGAAAVATVAGVVEHYRSKAAAAAASSSSSSSSSSSGQLHPSAGGSYQNPGSQTGGASSSGGGIQGPGGPPTTINTVDVILADGASVEQADGIGPAGSIIVLHAPPTGGRITANPIVDGFDAYSVGGQLGPGGQTASVRTTRSSGTVMVSWVNENNVEQSTAVNYGTPPPTSAPQQITVAAQGGGLVLTGCGTPGSLIVVSPPDGQTEFLSPYSVDGSNVDFQQGPGAQVSVKTTHQSGVIHIGWIDSTNTARNAQLYYGP